MQFLSDSDREETVQQSQHVSEQVNPRQAKQFVPWVTCLYPLIQPQLP